MSQLIPSASASDATSEEKSGGLPTFEEWFDVKMRKHPNMCLIAAEGFYSVQMAAVLRHWLALRELGKDGKIFEADSEEFKSRQQAWWHHYAKLNLIRSFMLRYFGVAAPDWRTEIMSEREYCGVVISQEDLEKFILKPGSGMVKQPVEDINAPAAQRGAVRSSSSSSSDPLADDEAEEEA